MGITIEERLSDSPFVERIWRSWSDEIDSFLSVAVFQWELVVWTQDGKTQASLQGTSTRAVRAPVPQNAEFFGIVFKPSVYMPNLPGNKLLNTSINLPNATNRSFWFMGNSWQLPTYDNAESFVNRLLKQDVIAHEPLIDDVLCGYPLDMSLRSIQRRFLNITGLNYRTMRQIERARRAAILLRDGISILDTTYALGYFDQSHLTHSLQTFIGQTPTQLITPSLGEQLSLLYKTDSFG